MLSTQSRENGKEDGKNAGRRPTSIDCLITREFEERRAVDWGGRIRKESP